MTFLSAEEELDLIDRIQAHGDEKDWKRLIEAFTPLAYKMAREFAGRSHSFHLYDDLKAVALEAIYKAVGSYDKTRGARFANLARLHIKNDCYWHIFRFRQPVKGITTGKCRVAYFALWREMRKRKKYLYEDLTDQDVKELAECFDLEKEELISLINLRYDMVPIEDVELPAEETDDDERERHLALVRSKLDILPERSREIIEMRCFDHPYATLDECAEKFGVSKERVRQIEEKAIEKLRKAIMWPVLVNHMSSVPQYMKSYLVAA